MVSVLPLEKYTISGTAGNEEVRKHYKIDELDGNSGALWREEWHGVNTLMCLTEKRKDIGT